jgi:hypothetical protein
MPRRHIRLVLRMSSRAAGGFADAWAGRCAPESPAAIMIPHTMALSAAGSSNSARTREAGLRAIRRIRLRNAASASDTGRVGTASNQGIASPVVSRVKIPNRDRKRGSEPVSPPLDLSQFPLLTGGQAHRDLTLYASLSVSVRLGYRP